MAIKRRERAIPDSAAIDSFGDAAEAPPERPLAPTPAPVTPSQEKPSAEDPRGRSPKAATVRDNEWPEGLSKTFLLRYPDPSIPSEIEELATLVGRNKHQTTLLALRRGVEALRREAEELGAAAELLK